MASTGLGDGDRPGDREFASARVTPDRSPERHCRNLQTPAAAPDRNTGGEGGAREIDLSRDGGRPIIDVERRAGKHHAIEVRERGAERKGLAVGDVQGSAANVRAMQVKGGGEERNVRWDAEIRTLGLPRGRRPLGNQYVRHQTPDDSRSIYFPAVFSLNGRVTARFDR